MKLVIIGGTGLIGSKLVTKLREQGHEAVPASPDTGVNTLTGVGLAEILQGASVVVDVSNSPSFEESAVMRFFTTSTRNLLKYAAAAGVRHYVALSVVGTERIPDVSTFGSPAPKSSGVIRRPSPSIQASWRPNCTTRLPRASRSIVVGTDGPASIGANASVPTRPNG